MVSLIPGMKHGHGAGWNPPDSYAFARSIVEDGTLWCRATETRVVDRMAEALFESAKPLENAVLISTTDSGVTGSRNWVETEAELAAEGEERWKVRAALPAETTAWFMNVHYDGLTASSGFKAVR